MSEELRCARSQKILAELAAYCQTCGKLCEIKYGTKSIRVRCKGCGAWAGFLKAELVDGAIIDPPIILAPGLRIGKALEPGKESKVQ